jgi:hypothetical protein
MRALGYVLLVLNLLATGGFAYLAMQDYYGEKGKGNGRQNITATAVRHILLLQGVPLEGGPDKLPARVSDPKADGYSDYAATEIPFPIDLAGGRRTDSVSPELLYAYFAQTTPGTGPVAAAIAGNTPVTSQVNEVKRVRDILKGMVTGNVQLLESLLLLQSESYEERAEIQELVKAGNAAELERRLFARFDQVINPTNARPDISAAVPTAEDTNPEVTVPPGATAEDRDAARAKARENLNKKLKAGAELRAGTAKDEAERRVRLAHLLVHLDRDAAWQKRVVLVVGLRQYVKALTAQVVRFGAMVTRIDRQTLDDQDAFLTQYDRLETLARQRTVMVQDMAETRKKLTEQQTRDQDFVNQRITQLNLLRQQLAAVKAEVAALLSRQGEMERNLFEVQREVGVTLDEIYRLEADLERRERELLRR